MCLPFHLLPLTGRGSAMRTDGQAHISLGPPYETASQQGPLASRYRTNLWMKGQKLMRLDAIAIGKNPPDDVNVIIEVAIGGEPIKYEMDKESGTLVVDRFLYTPMRYPGNYGFVPHTLSDDGDPIDVLVANTRPIVPGAVINVRPVGVLKMTDESGEDEKIIAVPSPKLTQRYMNVHNYTDLPAITLEQIQHFFEHYKDLEPAKWVKVGGWGDAAEAKALILDAIERSKKRSP
jgi:inorganic pyrophosphatase